MIDQENQQQLPESLSDRINIFLTVDSNMLNSYFNPHDPAPIYKRQLSHRLVEYIDTTVSAAKRYTAIFYKLKCTSEVNKQYAKPLLYAIRRHFALKKISRKKEFERFKRRSWILLGLSFTVAMLCHAIIPIIDEEYQIHFGISNSLEVFSWVILWRPIDKLIFQWNPHLKDIALLDKLENAEVIVIEHEK